MDLIIVDLDYGNRRSLERALERAQIPYRWRGEPPADERDSRAYLLPGVGSAGFALRRLEETGWAQRLRETSRPMVGICLGYQLLFEEVTEDGTQRALGRLKGTVKPLPRNPTNRRVPHIGWNRVRSEPSAGSLDFDGDFYFAHSYAVARTDDELAITDDFVSVAGREGVLGFQFHPELSGPRGLALLEDIWTWCKSFPPSI